MADSTVQVSDRLELALEPFRELIAHHDELKKHGGLEQQANEATARAQAAKRDLDAYKAELDQAKADLDTQLATAKAAIADADAQRKIAVNAAQVEAGTIISAANKMANDAYEKAQAELATLNEKQLFATKTLDNTNAQIADAQQRLTAINTEMTALKARLG